MALSSRAFLVAAILLLCGSQWCHCLRAEFYLNPNFTGFLEEAILTGTEEMKCTALRSGEQVLQSVKTDKCLILYQTADCKWLSGPREPSWWNVVSPNAESVKHFIFRLDDSAPSLKKEWVQGFHVCSQKLGGGPQLDLDFFLEPGDSEGASYRGVCGCRKVPAKFTGGKSFRIFIDNHGNSVNLYDDENCQGQSYNMQPGITYEELQVGKYPFNIRSFKPAKLKGCFRLAARIHKFHFENNTDSIEGLPMERVQLATDSVIKNNGSTEVTQTFKVSSTVSESVAFSVAKSFKETETTGVEAGVTMSSEVGVPLIASVEIQVSISGKYEWSKENSGETSNTTTVTTEETVEVEQQIKVPPCRTCTVASYVKKVKDFSIKYKAYAKVSAVEGTPSVSAKDLRDNLPAGLDYVKDIDQNTVEAVTEGTMSAAFGLKALIDVDCAPISGGECDSSQYSPSNDHQSYVIPLRRNGIAKRRLHLSSQPSTFLSFLRNAFLLFAKI